MKKQYFFFLLGTLGMQAQPGSLCTDPIVIASLPYTAADNTANYLDSYDPQTTTHPSCLTTVYGNYYHGGNDVIYSYTAAADGLIKVEIPDALGWTGMFIYTDCANIGVNYAACATGVSAGLRTITNFAVSAGQTYFIYISSWPSPQTVTYTLNVTDLSLGTAAIKPALDLVVYPNPVAEELLLETDLLIKAVTICTSNGQLIETKITNNKINVAMLQSGFYILEIVTDTDVKLYRKFVKTTK